MNYHFRQGAVASLIEPMDEPLSVIMSGGARRTVVRNMLFGFPQHPLTIISASGASRTISLKDTVFEPALPLVHRSLSASLSTKLKDSGRRLELQCGTYDITYIPAGRELEPGSIRLPESGIRYFHRLRQGLVKLIEIVHCLRAFRVKPAFIFLWIRE